MLVLMRKAGESIHIGPNIVVTLIALERNRARIGISAPRDITVDREEIAQKKRRDEQEQRLQTGESDSVEEDDGQP